MWTIDHDGSAIALTIPPPRFRRDLALAATCRVCHVRGVEAPSDEEAILASIGVRVAGDDLAELRAACMRIGRKIHKAGTKVVGFVPTDDRTAVPPLLVHLGLALCDLTGATVAVVDANVRYPGLSALSRGHSPDRETSVFSTRWLRGSLALLTPPRVELAGEVVPQLARVLLEGSDLFAHVLVDLTGFDLLGEHGSAAACMDAVALVGRRRRTRETQLRQLAELMPADRFLGVVLVG
jgi:hypothetical protein